MYASFPFISRKKKVINASSVGFMKSWELSLPIRYYGENDKNNMFWIILTDDGDFCELISHWSKIWLWV